MKRILLPSDLSALSDYAYDFAHRISSLTGAVIHVFSVIPAPPRAVFDKDGSLKNDNASDYSGWFAKKVERDKKLKNWARDKEDVVSTEVKIGRVREDIINYVDANDIDLIIMGTGGAVGMDEALRGTNAEYIINHASVPTICLKCDRSNIVINDILLVSDFQEDTPIKLEALRLLRTIFNARLHFLKVVTKEDFESSKDIHERMDRFRDQNDLSNAKYHIYNDESVEKGIINFCAESGIAFLAVGTHQRKGFNRLFKQSVTDGIVNHIYQPVLCFPVIKSEDQ